MSAPAIYLDGGQLKQFDSSRETVIDCQGVGALTVTSAAGLFDNVTSGNITIGAALTGNLTIGNASGNRIFIDNTGDNRIEIEGNLYVNGTETVTGNTTFDEDVQIGDDPATDVLTVDASSTFNGDVKFEDDTTVTFGTDGAPGNVTVDSTYARFSADIVFDGSAQAVTNAGANLTVSTTTSGDLLLTGADHVTVTTGTAAGDAFAINTDILYIDGNTNDVMINTSTALPSGNTATFTVLHDTADKPIISVKGGSATETSLLSGSTDPSGGGGVAAPRGSLYMLNTGSLYVKTNTGDTDWSEIGTTAGGTLQASYNASSAPATIAMSTSKNLVFQTNETVASESDFLVEQSGGNDYLLCDASADQIDIGSTNITIRMLNDVTMAGATPLITADSVDLTISTTTSGDVVLSPAGGVGVGTASPQANDVMTVSGSSDRLLALENTTDSAVVELMTGTDPTGITGTTGSLFLEYDGTTGTNAKLWINQSDSGSGTVWTEMSTGGTVTLQNAYDNGNTVSLDSADGDWQLTVDEASTYADWVVTGASGDYFKTDAENAEAFIGSAGVSISVDASLGSVGLSGGNYMYQFNAATGTTTYDTTNGAKTITGNGTNALAIANSGTGNLTLDVASTGTMTLTTVSGALTLTSTNGNIDIAPSGTGHVFVQNASNEGLEVADTGAITILGGGEDVSIADGSGAAGITLAGATGGIQIDNVGVSDQEIGINAGGDVDIDAGGNSATNGGDITLDALKGTGGGGIISLDAQGASNFTVDAADLTLSTTTSGTLNVTSVAALDMDGTVVTLDGSTSIGIGTAADVPIDVDASTFDLDASGALTLDSATSIAIGAAADVPVDVDASTFDLDASGALTLDSATSISIGATADVPIDIDSSTFDLDASDDITIDTTGAGSTIALTSTSAGAVNAITLQTVTSGDIAVTSAGDIDLSATGGEVTLASGTSEVMSILTGTNDPSSVATSANAGSLFLRDSTNGELYIKQDDGSSTNWDKVATVADAGDTIITLDAGGIFAAGDVIYVDSSGDAVAADADAAASSRAIGFAIDAAPLGTETDRRIQLAGEADVSATLSTLGAYVFVDTTAGAVSETAPSGTGDTVLRMGVVTATGAGTSKVVIQIGEPTLV